MKKILLSMVLCVIVVAAQSQTLLNLEFSTPFTIPSSLGTTTNGWITAGSAAPSSQNPWQVANPAAALSYSSGSDMYPLSGDMALNESYANDASATFIICYPFTATPITSGVVYMTFLFHANQTVGANVQVMGMGDSLMSNTSAKLMYGKFDAANCAFGVVRGSTSSADYKWVGGATKTPFPIANTYLIVVKYDIDAQTASLFIDPTLGTTTEPTPDVTDNSGANPKTNLKYLHLRVQGNNSGYFDVAGIRVTRTWTEAVSTTKNPVTEVTVPSADKGKVVSVKYYNVTGSQLPNAPSSGLYIEKATYENGSVESVKKVK